MKILLAIDGSQYSMKAVHEIANRRFPATAEIRIISAYERSGITEHMEPMGTLREYHAEIDKEAIDSAQAAVDNAKEIVYRKNPALTVTSKILEGSAKQVILREAETFGADLIVVGSHGYGAVKSFLLGSVSHSIALHAKCSVEIVR